VQGSIAVLLKDSTGFVNHSFLAVVIVPRRRSGLLLGRRLFATVAIFGLVTWRRRRR